MMIPIFLQRLTLFSALSAIVLGVFWPHVGPKLMPQLKRIASLVLAVIHNSYHVDDQSEHSDKFRPTTVSEHPKFSGFSLKKVTSEKQVS